MREEHRHVRLYRIANDWANPPYEVPMTTIYSNWRPSRPNSKSRRDYCMAPPDHLAWRPCSASPTFRGPFLPHDGEQRRPDRPYQSQEAVYGFMLEDLDHAVNVLETHITPRRNGRGRRSRIGGLRLATATSPNGSGSTRSSPSGHAHLERRLDAER
ncbi:MAG: SusD/RagB family nutrient-binding outer membrane lipoprotein [Alistipes finegoldii]